MIYDRLRNLTRYCGISPAFDRAVEFLRSAQLASLSSGHIDIDGETVYGNHFSYTTAPYSPDALFESHQKYLDLHIVLHGREKLAVASETALQKAEVLESEDSTLYTGAPEYTLPLDPDRFILLFPGEAHMPKLIHGSPAPVDKLVLKIIL